MEWPSHEPIDPPELDGDLGDPRGIPALRPAARRWIAAGSRRAASIPQRNVVPLAAPRRRR